MNILAAIACILLGVLVLFAIATVRAARRAGDTAKVRTWNIALLSFLGLLVVSIVWVGTTS